MPEKPNTTRVVQYLLSQGIWLRPYQIQQYMLHVYGHMASESAITARIRECRKTATIERRPCRNSTAHEYRMVSR
jgi:hypothetical protein